MTAVAQALVGYLLAHPAACDTADGIAHWWFDPEDGVSRSTLQQTLDDLTERGLIESTSAADGRVRYRRRADPSLLRRYLEGA